MEIPIKKRRQGNMFYARNFCRYMQASCVLKIAEYLLSTVSPKSFAQFLVLLCLQDLFVVET